MSAERMLLDGVCLRLQEADGSKWIIWDILLVPSDVR